jgi:hypothetical protein
VSALGLDKLGITKPVRARCCAVVMVECPDWIEH